MALVVESCPWEFLGLVSLMCPPPQPLIFSAEARLTGLNPYVCDFGYPINQRLRAVFSQL